MERKLGLRFGALCPSIEDQLKEQGFSYVKNDIKHFQKDAEAINRLRIRGLIPAGEIEKATKKLVNRIAAHIESMESKKSANN